MPQQSRSIVTELLWFLRTAVPRYVAMRNYEGAKCMDMLMIRCLKTGRPIFTGRYIEYRAFRAIPVFPLPALSRRAIWTPRTVRVS